MDKIITQYNFEEFVDTLKLSSTFKLIELRSYLSSLFFDIFNTRDDLSLKFRRGDNIYSSLLHFKKNDNMNNNNNFNFSRAQRDSLYFSNKLFL